MLLGAVTNCACSVNLHAHLLIGALEPLFDINSSKKLLN
jgi:hypothetical protein